MQRLQTAPGLTASPNSITEMSLAQVSPEKQTRRPQNSSSPEPQQGRDNNHNACAPTRTCTARSLCVCVT